VAVTALPSTVEIRALVRVSSTPESAIQRRTRAAGTVYRCPYEDFGWVAAAVDVRIEPINV
jgi:hypothetical protein